MDLNPPDAAYALRRAEDRLKVALVAGRMATWEWDPQTDSITPSETLRSLFGLQPGDRFDTSEHGFSIVHPDDRDVQRARVQAALRAGGSWQFEFRIVRPHDGEVVWLEERAHTVRNERTGHDTVLGVVWDITERKRVEHALRDSESRYRTLFDVIDQGFCIQEIVVDDRGEAVDATFVEVNPVFERMTGPGTAERTAEALWLHVKDEWLPVQARVAATGEPARFDSHVAACDRWFEVHCMRIGSPGERRVATVVTDVTERRHSEERLRRAADYDAFRVLLNETLRDLDDPLAIQAAAVALLGEQLQVDRASYADLEEARDGDYLCESASYPGMAVAGRKSRLLLAKAAGALVHELRAGRGIVARAIPADRRFTRAEREEYAARGIGAFVQLPLLKSGRLVALLSVEQSGPRPWTSDDVARVEETAQRTWAALERARTEAALWAAHEELEARVQERTRKLEALNVSLRQQVAERRRAEQARNVLLGKLLNAQEEERRRIARELHDQLGQQVSALVLKLAMVRQDAVLPPAVREQIAQLEKIARKTDSDLDFVVWQLRPTVLDDLGLVAALRDHAASWSEHFGVECRFATRGAEAVRLGSEIETVLYRFAQEALDNVARHARATHVDVRLERGVAGASLCIEDNGVGFDAEQLAAGDSGLGIAGMRERASFVGGEFTIQSKPGGGTHVKVDVPLPMAA